MKDVKHISFDFWNTLGIANPEYARERSRILAAFTLSLNENDGWEGHSIRYCAQAYQAVKEEIDADTLNFGHIGLDGSFDFLIKWLEITPLHHEVQELKADLWKAFYENPPFILDDVLAKLREIKESGITLSIGSNTNFIPGKVIRESVLDKLDLFDFYIFSDELGESKPSASFFSDIHKTAVYVHKGISPDSIVHVGDSKRFDYEPALKFGLKAGLVNNPYAVLPFLMQRF
jgi:FMN phosphatase YigB (HAD superfamily)